MSPFGAAGVAGSEPCVACGIPQDSRPFDVARLEPVDLSAMRPGEVLSLASFTLAPGYCGVLRYFSQYTDRLLEADDPRTPGLEWILRSNGGAVGPYNAVPMVLNPWGFATFPVDLRLDDGATIELVVRRVDETRDPAPLPPLVQRVGGRLVGRYWYNDRHGGFIEPAQSAPAGPRLSRRRKP